MKYFVRSSEAELLLLLSWKVEYYWDTIDDIAYRVRLYRNKYYYDRAEYLNDDGVWTPSNIFFGGGCYNIKKLN